MNKAEVNYLEVSGREFHNCQNCGQNRANLSPEQIRKGLTCRLVREVTSLEGICRHHTGNFIKNSKPMAIAAEDPVLTQLRKTLEDSAGK